MPRGARGDSRLDTLMAVACVAIALTLLILPPAPRDRVAALVRGNLMSPLALLQERAALARRAYIANDSLQRVADSVISRSLRLDAVEAENARLRELLGLGKALSWGYVPAEALMGRGMGEEHTLLLSVGARQGVQRLGAVVTAAGLVGVVERVDETTSVAIVWPHPDFRVSAITPDGASFGIVSAHEGEAAARYLLELHGVPSRAPLRVGTPVVSSGLGGIFPRGVLIGTVMREIPTTGGVSRRYLVQPAVRPADVTAVMILSPQRTAQGAESVWRPESEAMLRRIRSAADSLAAQDTTVRQEVP